MMPKNYNAAFVNPDHFDSIAALLGSADAICAFLLQKGGGSVNEQVVEELRKHCQNVEEFLDNVSTPIPAEVEAIGYDGDESIRSL